MFRSRTWRVVASVTALAALTAACGDDDDDAADDTTTTTAEAADDGGGETVEVTAVDYEFEDLPDEVEPGTSFALRNGADDEVHEIVAFLIPEGETRSAEELLDLPEEELGAVFGGEPEPAFVIVAFPGESGLVAVPPGGPAVLTESGRYVFACFIPVGAPAEAYREALAGEAEGPPDIPNPGPPHFTQGMFGEVTVS